MPAVELPAVAAEDVALAVLFLTAGLCVPFRYGIERLRGFGRYAVSRLPYTPPPGKNEEEAMVEATESEPDGEAEQ